jgi:hypothetical protein
MITSVTLGSIILKCDRVEKPPIRKTVTVEIPGRDADIIQDLGSSSRVITLEGLLKGAAMDTDKTTLEGYIGTNVSYNDGVLSATVYIQEVNIPTVGGAPYYYRFSIKCIEVPT